MSNPSPQADQPLQPDSSDQPQREGVPDVQPSGVAPASPPATHLPQHPGQAQALQPDDADREDPELQHESPV